MFFDDTPMAGGTPTDDTAPDTEKEEEPEGTDSDAGEAM